MNSSRFEIVYDMIERAHVIYGREHHFDLL